MEKHNILLLDAGTGNLHSVFNTLQALGANVTVSDKPDLIPMAERIILPGVGSFERFMSGLNQKGLSSPIKQFILSNRPLLGICVGMQALFDLSEEMGRNQGLGILSGEVKLFQSKMDKIKIPHTGWNQIWYQQENPLLQKIVSGDYVYFNHSYYCDPGNTENIVATTDYGIDFCSIIQHKNLFGVQFHPEKSQKTGLQILKNFIEWNGESL
jgi:glutamine amidotransferase